MVYKSSSTPNIPYTSSDLKTFIDTYSKLNNPSPVVLKQMVDGRIRYLVNQYNKCTSDVKIRFKKRIELILQYKFDKNIILIKLKLYL